MFGSNEKYFTDLSFLETIVNALEWVNLDDQLILFFLGSEIKKHLSTREKEIWIPSHYYSLLSYRKKTPKTKKKNINNMKFSMIKKYMYNFQFPFSFLMSFSLLIPLFLNSWVKLFVIYILEIFAPSFGFSHVFQLVCQIVKCLLVPPPHIGFSGLKLGAGKFQIFADLAYFSFTFPANLTL